MKRANTITLGAFTLITALLIIIAFVAVGTLSLFADKSPAMTVFDSSVEGLSVGSPVKYQGVTIGKVTRIALRGSDSYVDVYFNLSSSGMDEIVDGRPLPSSESSITTLIRQHMLKCTLNASSIMGGLHLELTGGAAEAALPDLKVTPPEGTLYLESIHSELPVAIQNISKTIGDLTKVDLISLNDKLTDTLNNVNLLFRGDALKALLPRLDRMAVELEKTIDTLQKSVNPQSVGRLTDGIDRIGSQLGSLNGALNDGKLRSFLTNADALIGETRSFITQLQGSGGEFAGELRETKQELGNALIRLENVLKALQISINDLEDQPNQIVRGVTREPIDYRKK